LTVNFREPVCAACKVIPRIAFAASSASARLYPASLTPATRMNLRLDGSRIAKLIGKRNRLPNRRGYQPVRDSNTGGAKKRFSLIFVQLHPG
jgi:hypothetical protein